MLLSLHQFFNQFLGLRWRTVDVEAHGAGVGPPAGGLDFGLGNAQIGAVGCHTSSGGMLTIQGSFIPQPVQEGPHVAQSKSVRNDSGGRRQLRVAGRTGRLKAAVVIWAQKFEVPGIQKFNQMHIIY